MYLPLATEAFREKNSEPRLAAYIIEKEWLQNAKTAM